MSDIRGLKPLVDLAPEALGIVLLLLALALVGVSLFRVMRQKTVPHAAPRRSISIRQRLELLRTKQPPPDQFCAALSEIMRDWLRARYGMSCRRLTTTEIVDELRRREVPPSVVDHLTDLFTACDLVKFAKAKPAAIELEQHLTTAYLVLEESR